MKMLVKTVKSTIKTMQNAIQKLAAKALIKKETARLKLAESQGDFVMDHAVVFVIILVIAAIVIALLVFFLQSELAPLLTQKIKDFFN